MCFHTSTLIYSSIKKLCQGWSWFVFNRLRLRPFPTVVNTGDCIHKPINFWEITYINTYVLHHLAFDREATKFHWFFLNFPLLLTLIAFLDKLFNIFLDVMTEKLFQSFLLSCIPSMMWRQCFCLQIIT